MVTVFKTIVCVFLLGVTVTAYGGACYGWFLTNPIKKPVSVREGSRYRHTPYLFYGRTHTGGGYSSGK